MDWWTWALASTPATQPVSTVLQGAQLGWNWYELAYGETPAETAEQATADAVVAFTGVDPDEAIETVREEVDRTRNAVVEVANAGRDIAVALAVGAGLLLARKVV